MYAPRSAKGVLLISHILMLAVALRYGLGKHFILVTDPVSYAKVCSHDLPFLLLRLLTNPELRCRGRSLQSSHLLYKALDSFPVQAHLSYSPFPLFTIWCRSGRFMLQHRSSSD